MAATLCAGSLEHRPVGVRDQVLKQRIAAGLDRIELRRQYCIVHDTFSAVAFTHLPVRFDEECVMYFVVAFAFAVLVGDGNPASAKRIVRQHIVNLVYAKLLPQISLVRVSVTAMRHYFQFVLTVKQGSLRLFFLQIELERREPAIFEARAPSRGHRYLNRPAGSVRVAKTDGAIDHRLGARILDNGRQRHLDCNRQRFIRHEQRVILSMARCRRRKKTQPRKDSAIHPDSCLF